MRSDPASLRIPSASDPEPCFPASALIGRAIPEAQRSSALYLGIFASAAFKSVQLNKKRLLVLLSHGYSIFTLLMPSTSMPRKSGCLPPPVSGVLKDTIAVRRGRLQPAKVACCFRLAVSRNRSILEISQPVEQLISVAERMLLLRFGIMSSFLGFRFPHICSSVFSAY